MRRVIAVGLALALLLVSASGIASAQGTGQTHVVQPGENLFRIALRYGVSINALAAVNGITNPTMIYVGQTLVIPAGGATQTGQPPSASTTGTGGTHVVAAGENLYRIALRYGLTADELAAANGITDPSSIYVGQVLRIPGVGRSPGTPAASVPPATNGAASGPKKIVISISRQHLWAYNGDQVVYSFVASTGLATSPTKSGTFRVLDKIPNAYASQWRLQMPYWLGIYYVGRIENGIHALPILSSGQRLWSGYLGRPVSFGCIVLDTKAAKQLYEWADIGTPVVVQP